MAKSAAIDSVGEGKLSTLKAWPQRAKSFYNDVRTEMRKVTSRHARKSKAQPPWSSSPCFCSDCISMLVDTFFGKTLDHLLKTLSR